MTTIAILPEKIEGDGTTYRAVAGKVQAQGKTAGEALDAMTEQLSENESSLLVIVQSLKPDRFFTAEQQQRLGELMQRWREARDRGSALPPCEQAELESLVEAELEAARLRAEAMLSGLGK
ncbi:MAG: hypothetical protein AB1631_21295 [Acidobacteriota bacterium]